MPVDTVSFRSSVILQFDWCLFSLLFSHSLVFDYTDVAVCFVFFYLWFLIFHNTSSVHTCGPRTIVTISELWSVLWAKQSKRIFHLKNNNKTTEESSVYTIETSRQ